MNTIQVYIHGENDRDPKLIEVPENASVREIIAIYHREFPNAGSPEEIELFIEEKDDPCEKDHPGHQGGIQKRTHIHCHRCKQVEVNIIYNGDDKRFHFTPSATAKRILRKAIEAFNISEADAGDYLLKLNDTTILQPSDHIGSFTTFPRCLVKLFLTATKPIQG